MMSKNIRNIKFCLILFALRCRTAGLEIRDGGTERSPLLGLFCGEIPHTQKSTGNTMYVRYYTNANSPKLGFYAKASIGTLKFIKVGPKLFK